MVFGNGAFGVEGGCHRDIEHLGQLDHFLLRSRTRLRRRRRLITGRRDSANTCTVLAESAPALGSGTQRSNAS